MWRTAVLQQDLPDETVMALDAGDGSRVLLPSACLLVFLDETGEASLSDPNYPLFGIGGCVVTVSQYASFLDQPWKDMKERWFGGKDIAFHSTDYANSRGSPPQYKALTHYVAKFPIGRIWPAPRKLVQE